jgi:hypothetical protein
MKPMTTGEQPVRRPSHAASRFLPPRSSVRGATIVWLIAVVGNIGLAVLWLPYAWNGGTELSLLLVAPLMIVYASLGWLILRHRPGHPIGWLLLGTALIAIVFTGGIGLGGSRAETYGPDDFLAGALTTVAVSVLVPFFVIAFGMMPILYPDGRLPSPRWRWPVGGVVAGTVVSTACFLLAPTVDSGAAASNPFAPPGSPAVLSDIAGVLGNLTVVFAGVLAVASVVVRFLRGHGDERQQLKWMIAPVVLVIALNVPTFMGVDVGGILSVVQVIVMLLIPVAITGAILRYRLYDIDRLISRTIAYSVVLALLVGLFVLGTLVLQSALEGMTQGDTLAVAASTLLAFAAAQPLWRRIRRLVDQRFDRARIDAARTAAAFSDRQRDRVDLEAVVNDVRTTVDATLRPASIGLWLRDDGV